ncbi:MAG: B12-binding domain-containing radical SAM protein [Elusimicrobia bacterium]|nr:B12-binding domain-containing radical SAM protein [Elusimicrobiota bacterium]
MRLLLVTPENRFIKAFRRGQFNNFVQLTMPYLAGFVPRRHEVALVDEYNEPLDVDAKADLVALTCNTPNAAHVYALADAFRARGRLVVLGGPHATLLPEEAKAHADAVVVGEAETSWPRLLRDAEQGTVEPFYREPEPPALDGLPFARRDLIRGRAPLQDTIIATRGCPHRCAYCNLRQIYDPKIRFRPVEDVAAEVRTFRSPFFTFWDDQLFMNRRYALRLFDAIAGAGRRWAAMVTLASTQDETLLRAASRAGCVCLFLGLESFSPESLRLANKAFNVVGSYREGVERIHRFGMTVQAGIVFGFDGDGEDVFERTLREAAAAGLDGATVSILTPFPKTPVWEQLRAQGRLLTEDWSYYNGKTAVAFRPARMSPERLWDGYQWFRRRFFSPSCILERVRRSGVRPLQSAFLNWGYHRALGNRIPGRPIPRRSLVLGSSGPAGTGR